MKVSLKALFPPYLSVTFLLSFIFINTVLWPTLQLNCKPGPLSLSKRGRKLWPRVN